tara:strand:+ start:676 stop:2064 length:1389 start_codon:yes stop_codon:yes gene_type:complete
MLDLYFAAKTKIYPQYIKGKFRNLKWLLNSIFLSIYLFTPLIRYNRQDIAPSQAILIDLPNRKAYFFFIEIWPQELFYFMGLLLLAAVILFFITSLFGRIWCGYACFQTVWTDLFIGVEKLIQGDRNSRILLDRKNNIEKYVKKFLTHSCWIVISLITAIAFICYFNDIYEVINNIIKFELTFNQIGWILGITIMTYIMAGFAREHVCTYMCPYARFQSAMFDDNSLIISYDKKRGEPRQKAPKDNDFSNRGHCIDCKQCVVVCPTGIDIRDGLQMECIACGLCIDACNQVMDKFNLPRNLIKYDTLAHINNPINKNKFSINKPRTYFYLAIIIISLGTMIFGLSNKSEIEYNISSKRVPLYVKLSDGSIRNSYILKIINKTLIDKNFAIISDNKNFKISTINQDHNNIYIKGQEISAINLLITADKDYIKNISQDQILLNIILHDKKTDKKDNVDAIFIIR